MPHYAPNPAAKPPAPVLGHASLPPSPQAPRTHACPALRKRPQARPLLHSSARQTPEPPALEPAPQAAHGPVRAFAPRGRAVSGVLIGEPVGARSSAQPAARGVALAARRSRRAPALALPQVAREEAVECAQPRACPPPHYPPGPSGRGLLPRHGEPRPSSHGPSLSAF